MSSNDKDRRLYGVRSFYEKNHDWIKYGGLRWWLFHAKENGLEMALVRVGRRVYIDEEKFFQWIDGMQQSGNTGKPSGRAISSARP
jgi:hypothetical protein